LVDPIDLIPFGAIAGVSKAAIGAGLRNVAGAAASDSGALGLTTLFRAVSRAELDDIARRGFQLKLGGYESKLFTTSLKDAAAFGRELYKLDDVPFHVVQMRVPNSLVKQFWIGTLDSKPAISVPETLLPALNSSMTWKEISAIPLSR
jgi:hypothetical protein